MADPSSVGQAPGDAGQDRGATATRYGRAQPGDGTPPTRPLLAVVAVPEPSPPGAIVATLDLALVAETNVRDLHGWAVRARRTRQQVAAVLRALAPHPRPAGPWVVHVHRVAWNRADTDNLVTAGKHVRDAVCGWLEVDDCSPAVRWVLSQSTTRERRRVQTYANGHAIGWRMAAAASVCLTIGTDGEVTP